MVAAAAAGVGRAAAEMAKAVGKEAVVSTPRAVLVAAVETEGVAGAGEAAVAGAGEAEMAVAVAVAVTVAVVLEAVTTAATMEASAVVALPCRRLRVAPMAGLVRSCWPSCWPSHCSQRCIRPRLP